MKIKLYICYISTRGLGPAHVCLLVGVVQSLGGSDSIGLLVESLFPLALSILTSHSATSLTELLKGAHLLGRRLAQLSSERLHPAGDTPSLSAT